MRSAQADLIDLYVICSEASAAVAAAVAVSKAVSAAAAVVTAVVAAVSAETEEENKGDYNKPDGGILEEFANAVHMIHPFIITVSLKSFPALLYHLM